MRKFTALLAAALLVFGGAGCGDDDDDTTTAGDTPAKGATQLDVTATDYSFAVPATFQGGVVEMNYKNDGKEPHFAAFAKPADGKSIADVKAFFSAPPAAGPSGPPPFIEWAGAATADPGGTGKLSFELPAGSYALFCAIPSPDGVSHAAKGMVAEVTVTEANDAELPESVGTITGADFSLVGLPELEEGTNVVGFRNEGKQLHEINLIELTPGKTMDDFVAWAKEESGPPPSKFHSGVAVKPGEEGTAEFDLKKGSTYAFMCAIPDVLSDFTPHVAKGMATGTFTV